MSALNIYDRLEDSLQTMVLQLAYINQNDVTETIVEMAAKKSEILDKLQTKALFANGLAALGVTGAFGALIVGAPVAVVAAAAGGGALFAGNMLYNLGRKQFGNHEKAALDEMRRDIQGRSPSEPLSAKVSQFFSKSWAKVREIPAKIDAAFEQSLQTLQSKPAPLVGPLTVQNQAELAANPQPATPMTTAGLHSLREAIARQLQGMANAVQPSGPPRVISEIAGEAADNIKAKVVGGIMGVVAKVEAVEAALDAKASAGVEKVTSSINLAKAFMTRVSQAYQVLKGNMEVAQNPQAVVTQSLQRANVDAGLQLDTAAEQAHETRGNIQGLAPTLGGAGA